MYRVFNMGIGFVIIVQQKDVKTAMDILNGHRAAPVIIGDIKTGKRDVIYNDQPV